MTQADTAIERAIRGRIAAAYPDHGLVGEEYGTEAGDAPTRWYIDPIDGTHNFIRGVPLFGTLLAVERDGELQAAVLSAPALGERWWARRGGGSVGPRRRRRRRPAPDPGVAGGRDSPTPRCSTASAATSRRRAARPGFDGARSTPSWRERGFGDFWGYALLAEGAAEAMVEVGLSSWDAAAPTVLVEEAGGRATDFDGRRAIDAGTFLATNGLAPRRGPRPPPRPALASPAALGDREQPRGERAAQDVRPGEDRGADRHGRRDDDDGSLAW